MRVISPAAEKLRLRCKCNTCVASSALDEIALHQLLGDSHMPVRHETSAIRCARTNASATCPFLLRHRCTISSAILLQVAPLLCPFIKGSAIYNFVYIVTQQSYPVKHIFQIDSDWTQTAPVLPIPPLRPAFSVAWSASASKYL